MNAVQRPPYLFTFIITFVSNLVKTDFAEINISSREMYD